MEKSGSIDQAPVGLTIADATADDIKSVFVEVKKGGGPTVTKGDGS